MWTGVVMAFVSGFFMFSADAADFYLKREHSGSRFGIVLVALICGVVVYSKTRRDGASLPSIPVGAKILAFISLIFWIGAILASVEVPAISGVG